MHLEHILWYLDNHPNYHAVILDEPLFENVALYVKGESHALLMKETDPFALFEIAEQSLASSLHEYLRYLMKSKMPLGSRHTTVTRLQEELCRLTGLLSDDNSLEPG